ncbi:13425_t:CDS:1 [Cetraspora pellucida]|uniref:13425_t:CDS:1 n=1 Tax=Cetraspora pellucida TaxID=1433469 RepID=A0A9N9D5F9_9GLOM|nr:13425_t:CDS:1 [Cetraspora pellucida]
MYRSIIETETDSSLSPPPSSSTTEDEDDSSIYLRQQNFSNFPSLTCSASTSPIIEPETTVDYDDDSTPSLTQRASELHFMVQKLINTHLPHLQSKILKKQDFSNEVDDTFIYKGVGREYHYTYDAIKKIVNDSWICNHLDIPPYFADIYDTTDGFLECGVDADDFFIFSE